ncbi:MAG: hypothetical protein IT328_03205 [Caldilineaceae bacterium]|nr:hypothetical protein [Caldilineaceae bacterium]
MGFLLICALIWLVALGWAWRRHTHHAKDTLYRDLLAAGGLVLATLAFFWRVVSGDVYQPADGGDLVSFLFPTYHFAAAELARGTLPLWNPTLYGGAPFISDIQAGFLYPPNLLLFLLQPNFGYPTMQWLVLGHIAWAGIGMYLLLRTLGWPNTPVSRPAAIFGALAFMFCDSFLVHLGNLNLIALLSWLPWVLAVYSRGLANRDDRGGIWLAVASLLFALANYAGHAQSSLYLGLALGIYTLGWAFSQWREDGWRGVGASALRLAIVGILALLLTAPILLPAIELTAYTERSGFNYQDTTAFSLAPTQLIGVLTPGFFGRGPALHWSLWDRVETPFAGVATALLAVGALLMAPSDLRRRLWPWIGIAAIGLGTALGVYAILHGWLTLLIPPLAQMRAPARALILWNLGIAVVAAVGVNILLRTGQDALAGTGGIHWRGLLRRGAQLWFAIILPLGYLTLFLTQESETTFLRASVALLALVFAALWWLGTWAVVAGLRAGWWSSMTAAGLLIALLFFDLTSAGAYTDVSPLDPTIGFEHPAIVDFLRADPDRFRIDTRTDIDSLWQPDTAALYGLEDVGGIVNPLALQQWQAQWEATGGRATRAYDMLNVKYVIVRDGTLLPEGKFELAFDAPGDLAVYSNSTFMPRAWVVHDARVASDVANALSQIQAPDFDPLATVILLDNEELAGSTPYGPLTGPLDPGSSQATLSAATSSSLTFHVNAAAAGFLVLSELWYPGWQATVHTTVEGDEQTMEQMVIHANGSLRAVPIPAGESTVELHFRPLGWRWGQVLAGLGLMGVAVLVWSARRVRNVS